MRLSSIVSNCPHALLLRVLSPQFVCEWGQHFENSDPEIITQLPTPYFTRTMKDRRFVDNHESLSVPWTGQMDQSRLIFVDDSSRASSRLSDSSSLATFASQVFWLCLGHHSRSLCWAQLASGRSLTKHGQSSSRGKLSRAPKLAERFKPDIRAQALRRGGMLKSNRNVRPRASSASQQTLPISCRKRRHDSSSFTSSSCRHRQDHGKELG